MPDSSYTRRQWLLAAGASLVALRPLSALATAAAPAITIHKDPNCGCCAKWVDHMRAAGFATTVRDESDMDAVKRRLGVPAALASCHTALVGGYVVEGHVPAGDVLRLLREKPRTKGIAVPGMPTGSPGMETSAPPAHYEVMAFEATGATKVFAKH